MERKVLVKLVSFEDSLSQLLLDRRRLLDLTLKESHSYTHLLGRGKGDTNSPFIFSVSTGDPSSGSRKIPENTKSESLILNWGPF